MLLFCSGSSVRFVGSIAVSAIYTRKHAHTHKISSNKTIQLKVNRKFRNFVILERICYQIIMTMTGNRNRTPTPTMTMLMMMMLVEAQKNRKLKFSSAKVLFPPSILLFYIVEQICCVLTLFSCTLKEKAWHIWKSEYLWKILIL